MIQQNFSITKVPFEYSWQWLFASFNLARKFYGTALGLSVLSLLLLVAMYVPHVGGSIYGFLSILISTGFLLVAHDWRNKKDAPISRVFAVFSDTDLFRRVFPIAILNMLLTMFGEAITQLGKLAPELMIASMLLSLIVGTLSWMFIIYAPALVVFKKVSTTEALKLSFKAITKNIITESVFWLLFISLIVLCVFLLVFPVLFICLPITISVSYIKYLCIFEDFKLENLDLSPEVKESISSP